MTPDFFTRASITTTAAQPRESISYADMLRDIKATMAQIEAKAPADHHTGARFDCGNADARRTLLGEPVFVDSMFDNRPKMQLKKKVADNLPPAFVAEMNAWMLEFFGTESQIFHAPGVGFFMGRKAYEQMMAVTL